MWRYSWPFNFLLLRVSMPRRGGSPDPPGIRAFAWGDAPRAAMMLESADKPNFVVDGHPSGMRVTTHLVRPTRRHFCPPGQRDWRLTWPCSGRGFPCRRCYQRRGALLPHHFTLAFELALEWAVCFLWHFPSRCRAQPLAGALPYGVRTFLDAPKRAATVWRTPKSPNTQERVG